MDSPGETQTSSTGVDFIQLITETTEVEEVPENDRNFLIEAGLVESYPQNWEEAEQMNSICRFKLVATVYSVCLIVQLWPIQFYPLMFFFFWWISIRGYLTLWEVTK
ncbi:MAG: hypothetical protein WAW33_02175 [Minisyncoccia bacterium]